ncbi:MAG: phosphate acyltransferase PlsX [Chloroflexi bacterium]|nr:phosphate acyltransferase PlsX [Chloroflexota bacterium]
MRIALDAMGGDRGPEEVVRGGVEAARVFGVEVALVGIPDAVDRALAPLGPVPAGVTVVPAASVITMDEPGATAARAKRDASILVGLREVKEGRADAFVSAGNTGAVMAASVLVLARIRGVERPALGTVFPASGGGRVLIIDVGANAEARASYLAQFAVMGNAYARDVLGVSAPRIGLLSIGEEASKGNTLIQEAHTALSGLAGIRFIGNVEGRDIPRGVADVIVTDGFTGNVAIKVAEGAAEFILGELRTVLTSRLHYKLAAALLRPAFRILRRRLDYQEYGGAPLLGVNGTVIVAHGRSDARAIVNAVRVARDAAAGHVIDHIREAMKERGAGSEERGAGTGFGQDEQDRQDGERGTGMGSG